MTSNTPSVLRSREEELAALIAEQEADDTDRIWQREMSLDATLNDDADAGTWYDVHGEDDAQLAEMLGDDESWVQLVSVRQITDEDIKLWRHLKERQGWTFQQIAEHVGRSHNTIKKYLPRYSYRRTRTQIALNEKFKLAKRSYEKGDRLIDVAEHLYEAAGYKTPESCYQALRRLFLRRRVAIRPASWKHGMRSRSVPREVYIAYWKAQNRKARERRHAALAKCSATTREGNPCSRFARNGTTLCNVHAGLSGGPTVWTYDRLVQALNDWYDGHGRYPVPAEWRRADVAHPNFKTVYNTFGSWPNAISVAKRRRAWRDIRAAV